MTARYIDDLADYLAANVTGLARFNPDTNPTGNTRTDTVDVDRLRALQVICFEGAPRDQLSLGQSNPVRHVNTHVEVFGETFQAHDMALSVYNLLNGMPIFTQGDTTFMQVELGGGIIPRGQWKPGITNYGIDLEIKYHQ